MPYTDNQKRAIAAKMRSEGKSPEEIKAFFAQHGGDSSSSESSGFGGKQAAPFGKSDESKGGLRSAMTDSRKERGKKARGRKAAGARWQGRGKRSSRASY